MPEAVLHPAPVSTAMGPDRKRSTNLASPLKSEAISGINRRDIFGSPSSGCLAQLSRAPSSIHWRNRAISSSLNGVDECIKEPQISAAPSTLATR